MVKCKSYTDRKPDETGIYVDDRSLNVNVWVGYVGRCHGSDDYLTRAEEHLKKYL